MKKSVSFDYSGRVALITGGADGIGRATALAFAESGANVVVADWDAEKGEEILQSWEPSRFRPLHPTQLQSMV